MLETSQVEDFSAARNVLVVRYRPEARWGSGKRGGVGWHELSDPSVSEPGVGLGPSSLLV